MPHINEIPVTKFTKHKIESTSLPSKGQALRTFFEEEIESKNRDINRNSNRRISKLKFIELK